MNSFQRQYAASLNNIGVVLHGDGCLDLALAHFRKAAAARADALGDLKKRLVESVIASADNDIERIKEISSHIAKQVPMCVGNEATSHQWAGGPNVDMFHMKRSGLPAVHTYNVDEMIEYSLPMRNEGAQHFVHDEVGDLNDAAINLYNLGLVHHQCGSLHTATRIFSVASSLCSTTELEATILNNFGQILYRMGDFDQAMKNFVRALKILAYDKNRPSHQTNRQFQLCMKMSLSGVCRVLYSRGESEFALDFAWEALYLSRLAYGEGSINVALSVYNLGMVYYQRGDLGQALQCCRSFLDRAQRLPGDYRIHMAEARYTIGTIHYMRGELDAAKENITLCLKARRFLLSAYHCDVAKTLQLLGRVHHCKGMDNEAVELFTEALRIQKLIAHSDAIDTLCNLAEIHHIRGQLDGALHSYMDALEEARALAGSHDGCVVHLLTKVAHIHIERGEVRDAMEKFAHASRLRHEIVAIDPTAALDIDILDEGSFPAAPAA